MAKFRVGEYLDILTNGYHNATTWEAALDPEFTQIIDKVEESKEFLKEWVTPLPTLEDPNKFYKDLENVYVRVKIHIDNTESNWVVLNSLNQREQLVLIVGLDGEITETNSLDIGMR
jgi:oligoendopeptidase F